MSDKTACRIGLFIVELAFYGNILIGTYMAITENWLGLIATWLGLFAAFLGRRLVKDAMKDD